MKGVTDSLVVLELTIFPLNESGLKIYVYGLNIKMCCSVN